MRGLPTLSLALALAATLAGPAGARQEKLASGVRQCINPREIRDETAESDTRLIFHVGGGKAYRNRLPAPCDNLRSINNASKIRLHPTGEDLCQGDRVEVLDHGGGLLGAIGVGDTTQSASCTLGDFEPLSEMSLTEELRR